MNQKNKNIAIIILAAGSSSRLGRPKQLLEFHGNTLLQNSINTALNISNNVIVVLGANEKLIRPTLSDFPIEIILNENWPEGMSSSIRTGMSILENKNCDAVLIMLCDQPFVDAILLEKMISVFEKSELPILASEYEGKVGVPAIFDISFFQKLKTLEGQKGAKALIINNLERVERVIFEKGKIDIDTEEDWDEFKQQR
ncbi:MAG: NTP transferase domain-containing protein [Saprospiraceae bacterium]